MRRKCAKWFIEVEPVTEVRALGFFAIRYFRIQIALRPQVIPHISQQVCVFSIAFGQNVARPVECGFCVCNASFRIQILGGKSERVALYICQDVVGQGLKPRFTSNLSTCATLNFKGCVKIFQALLGVSLFDGELELWGELILLSDRTQNRCTTVFQVAQIQQTGIQVT